MKHIRVRVTFQEEILGMASGNKKLHEEFIASKAPDKKSLEEEIASLGEEAVVKKEKTVFSKDKLGNPIFWDYQIKGFFKDSAGMLRKVEGTESSKVKAYKKEIDGLIFLEERQIPIHLSGKMGDCQRPLRGSTPQGERIALANSETCPAGSWIEFTVKCLVDKQIRLVKEWLDYGELRGMGQWRNSGKGRFTYEILKTDFDFDAKDNESLEKPEKKRRGRKSGEIKLYPADIGTAFN